MEVEGEENQEHCKSRTAKGSSLRELLCYPTPQSIGVHLDSLPTIAEDILMRRISTPSFVLRFPWIPNLSDFQLWQVWQQIPRLEVIRAQEGMYCKIVISQS
jgi:hypothetical protein